MLTVLAAIVSTTPLVTSSTNGAHFFFGPTANVPAPQLSQLVTQLVATEEGQNSWSGLRQQLGASGGSLHLRTMALGEMNATQQTTLATESNKLDLDISVESGGALCGKGTGEEKGNAVLESFKPFLSAGGTVKYLLLESIFSRTHAGCKTQPLASTVTEVAAFALALKGQLNPTGNTTFFLYDALPHYSVGEWPANVPTYGLDLGTVLTMLQLEMQNVGVPLSGYWLDSPMEYSRDYPNKTTPYPAGSGYKKIAAAVRLVKGMGLKVGKTFNSQAGGQTSAEAFYHGTMYDVASVAAVVPALTNGADFDFKMVETWYSFPSEATPETTPYTTAYTTLAAIKAWKQ